MSTPNLITGRPPLLNMFAPHLALKKEISDGVIFSTIGRFVLLPIQFIVNFSEYTVCILFLIKARQISTPFVYHGIEMLLIPGLLSSR